MNLLRACRTLARSWKGRAILAVLLLALVLPVWLGARTVARAIEQPDLIPGMAGMLVFSALLFWWLHRLDSLAARVKKLENARDEEIGSR